MKKKIVALVATLILAVTLLAGCTEESIYTNTLVTDVEVTKVEDASSGETHYYYLYSGDKKYEMDVYTYEELSNYVKSTTFNGLVPKVDIIVNVDMYVTGLAIHKEGK